jgi:deoxyribodipyrimidine photo-lyase
LAEPERVIHWFRRDLRLEDNTALAAALRSGDRVLPVFILDDAILAHGIDPRRLSFLRTALEDLDQQLRRRGGSLLVRRGDAARELNHVAEEAEAWGVYLNRDHTPYARQRDTRATRGLQMTGVVTQTFDDLLLVSPQLMIGADGLPPVMFEDFSRVWLELLDIGPEPEAPVEGTLMTAGALESLEGWGDSLAPIGDEPAVRRGATTESAHLLLEELLGFLPLYRGGINGVELGSSLWPALSLGTLSVREVARAVLAHAAADESSREGAEAFVLDLCHREHAYHLVHAGPQIWQQPGPEGDYVRHWLGGNPLT